MKLRSGYHMMSLLSTAQLLTTKSLQINNTHHQSNAVRTKNYEIEENEIQMKPRFLCLHGFRTSAAILKKQIGRWPEALLGKLDLVFADGHFPATGRSDVQGFFDPPYYEWYQTNQGAFLSAALPGMQMEGVALRKVPKIKFVIIISGAKFGGLDLGFPKLAANNAFLSPVKCPSLHIIGERDFLKERGVALLESFEDPIVIYHSMGHTVPRLDGEGLETMLSFIAKIQEMLLHEE